MTELLRVVAYGVVKDGVLRIVNRKTFDQAVGNLKGDVVVTVEKKHSFRTERQNKWYWGCIVRTLSDEWGWDIDDMHEYLKQHFNAKTLSRVSTKTGEILDSPCVPQSTAKMKVSDFMEYCEKIRRWAAEQGIVIPDPHTYEQLTGEVNVTRA